MVGVKREITLGKKGSLQEWFGVTKDTGYCSWSRSIIASVPMIIRVRLCFMER
jgi:hypothetical protein